MTVEVGNRLAFQSPRSSVASSESGIGLSESSSEQDLSDYFTRNSRPSHPCIVPYDSSPLFFAARNKSIGMSASIDTENANPDSRERFREIISKLARHPWTESTEFKELWSDIPNETIDRNQTELEKRASENDGTSVSNIVADSIDDSPRLSLVQWKRPWSASTEFVELWSDIPSELVTSQNQPEGRKELMDQNNVTTTLNASSLLSRDAVDSKRYPAATSGIFKNSCTESELTEVRSIAPEDSTGYQNNSENPEQGLVIRRLFSECIHRFQNFLMCFKSEVFCLVMKVMLSLLPLSAFFMGIIHFGTCPANEAVTLLVNIAGLTGVFLISCHIGNHFHFTNDCKDIIRRLIQFTQTVTAILLIIEMILFYSMSPNFENSENYCDEIFYNYTFYMNIAATGIVFLSVLLQ